TSDTFTVEVTNAGESRTGTLAARIDGDSDAFIIDTTGCDEFKLPPAGACELTVGFSPQRAASLAAWLSIVADNELMMLSPEGTGAGRGECETCSAVPAGNVVADGVAEAAIRVTVLDSLGLPVPGVHVEVSATGDENTVLAPTAPTDIDGIATGTLSSTRAEA